MSWNAPTELGRLVSHQVRTLMTQEIERLRNEEALNGNGEMWAPGIAEALLRQAPNWELNRHSQTR